MTQQDKIKELDHIQQMIVNRGDADEINARVFCLLSKESSAGKSGVFFRFSEEPQKD